MPLGSNFLKKIIKVLTVVSKYDININGMEKYNFVPLVRAIIWREENIAKIHSEIRSLLCIFLLTKTQKI